MASCSTIHKLKNHDKERTEVHSDTKSDSTVSVHTKNAIMSHSVTIVDTAIVVKGDTAQITAPLPQVGDSETYTDGNTSIELHLLPGGKITVKSSTKAKTVEVYKTSTTDTYDTSTTDAVSRIVKTAKVDSSRKSNIRDKTVTKTGFGIKWYWWVLLILAVIIYLCYRFLRKQYL